MKSLAFLSLLLAGCISVTPPVNPIDKIKSDLIGHTMGGREKSYQFLSVDQIISLRVLGRTENTVTISLLLRGVNKYFLADALLTYKNGKLVSVGELFIQQL